MRHSWEEVGPDAETTAAASALTSVVLERDLDRLRDWLARQPSADPRWRKAAFLSEALLYLTPDELEALGEAIIELVLAVQSSGSTPSAGRRARRRCRCSPSGSRSAPTATGN